MQINSVSSYQYSYNNQAVNRAKNNTTALNFGLHNPQAAMQRALELKALYAQCGLKYALPEQTISSGKIAKMVENVDLQIKNLFEKGKITDRLVKKEINKILPPKDKNSIIPVDIKKLPKYLQKHSRMSKEEIDSLMKNCAALQTNYRNKKLIFIPFSKIANAKNKEYTKIDIRVSLAHELTHALNSKYQNFETAADFHFEQLSKKFTKFFFNKFEMNGIYPMISEAKKSAKNLDQSELCNLDFNKYFNINSEEDLFKKFEKISNDIVNENYEMQKDKYNTKQFYQYCKARARDEKLAYKTDLIFKEYSGYKNPETIKDFASQLYGAAEKFFAQKAKTAEKAVERKRLF